MKKVLLLVVISFISSSVYAGSMTDNYITAISVSAAAWTSIIVPAANKIFLILWAFETFIQCVTKHFFDFTKIKELIRFLAVRILFFSFFTYAMTKPDFYLGIIQYLAKLGQASTGGGSGITGINPGWVWEQYGNWLINEFLPAQKSIGGLSNVGVQISLSIASDTYICTMCVISFLIIMLEIQVTTTLYGALILTGCAGSEWTKSWWNNYLGACVGLGIKVMMFCFLYAALQSSLTYHFTAITGSYDIWKQIINAIICCLCLAIIPGKIGSMVSGAAGGNFGGEMIGLAMAGLAIASKTTSAVTSAVTSPVSAVKSTMGAVQSIGSGLNYLKNLGANKGSNNQSTQPLANSQSKSDFLNDKKNG